MRTHSLGEDEELGLSTSVEIVGTVSSFFGLDTTASFEEPGSREDEEPPPLDAVPTAAPSDEDSFFVDRSMTSDSQSLFI